MKDGHTRTPFRKQAHRPILRGMSLEITGILIVVAVGVVMAIPALLSRRIDHGEARFDTKPGKIGDDE